MEEEEPLSHRPCDGAWVMSPGQVFADVNPGEPETIDSLPICPIDGDGGVPFSLSLPVIYSQHLYFAHVEMEIVVLAPRH